MLRASLSLVASLALSLSASAADLPAGTWAVNLDGKKGDLLITQVKEGKVSGALLGTDFTGGTWNGKELRFLSGDYTFEAQLVSEPGEDNKTKYTLTGSRLTVLNVASRAAAGVHVIKSGGWYAQITADTPVVTGEIKAEVRGVFVVDGKLSYILVKRQNLSVVEETRVWIAANADEWKALKQTPAQFDGKEVVVTGQLAVLPGGWRGLIPGGSLYFLDKFDIKLAK